MAHTQSVSGTDNRGLSLEVTFHDLLLSLKKLLKTYFHLLFQPHKVMRVITSTENTGQSTYASPIALLIISAIFSAGFIKSMVFDSINEVNTWSIEIYDKYIRDYTIFSNIIFVVGITAAVTTLAIFISIFLLIIARLFRIIPLRIYFDRFQHVFSLSTKAEFKFFIKLQYYYISIYLISTTVLHFCKNAYEIDTVSAAKMGYVIEIGLSLLASISIVYTVCLNSNKPKIWLLKKIIRELGKKKKWLIGFLAYRNTKHLIMLIVLFLFTATLYYSLRWNNPTCKSVTKYLLEIIGQDQYISPIQIYGFKNSDTLDMVLKKDTNNQYRIETDVCIKGDKEKEICLKRNGFLQLFKETESKDFPTYVFGDTCCEYGDNRDFIKIPAGSSNCFAVFAHIDSLEIQNFKKRVLNPRGVFIKTLVVPNKIKSTTYVQHLHIHAIGFD